MYNKHEKTGNYYNKPVNKSYNKSTTAARIKVEDFHKQLTFDENWITKGADENFITYAENIGKYIAPMEGKDNQCLSKSQIRNVYGEIKRIQLKGIDCIEGKTSFMLLKPKVAYAEGRNRTMGLTLFKKVFDDLWNSTCKHIDQPGVNVTTYNNFCAIIEAILAYHKAFGGND